MNHQENQQFNLIDYMLQERNMGFFRDQWENLELILDLSIDIQKSNQNFDRQEIQAVELVKANKENLMQEIQVVGQQKASTLSINSNQQRKSQSVKRKCNCSKSKCLRDYCECFKLGIACGAQCECINCCNNVKLFLIPKSLDLSKIKCKCQKSKCSKKYCECYSSGKGCGMQCLCRQCQNSLMFGITHQQQKLQTLRKRVKSDPQISHCQKEIQQK